MKLVDLLNNVDPNYEYDEISICDKWKKISIQNIQINFKNYNYAKHKYFSL